MNVGALTSFTEANGWTFSLLQASNGGTVHDGSLTTLSNVNLTISGSTAISTAQLKSYAGGTIAIDGGSPSSGLTSFNGSNITVSGGGTLSLPGVTSYTGIPGTTTLEATGTGSVLTLANLTSVTQPTNNYQAQTNFEALAGGTVTLSALATINTGTVVLESDGTGSVLNVGALTSFTEANGWTFSLLQASNGGTVHDGSLTSLSNVNLTLNASTAISTSQLTSYAGGTITVNGGSPSFSGLTTFNGSSITVSGGGTVSLPGVTSYTGIPGTTVLEATGTGSTLTLPHLSSVTQPTNNYQAQTEFLALAGGTLNLPVLATINTGTVVLESDGTDSVLNLPNLATFVQTGGWTNSTLQVSNGGTLVDPGFSQLSGVNLIGSSTGTFTISPVLGLSVSGVINVQVGTLLDEGDLNVQNNGTLNIQGNLSVNSPGILTSATGGTIEVSGNVLATTQNADAFNPQGTVQLNSGTGTSHPPQQLEAMSADMGAVQTGFVHNFAFGTLVSDRQHFGRTRRSVAQHDQYESRGRLCGRADRQRQARP